MTPNAPGTADGTDTEQLRRMIRAAGVGRMAIGAALMLAPGIAGRGWIGADASRPGVKAVIRALGIRDLLLGAGAYQAAQEGRLLRRWVELGMVADAVDLAATLLAARHLGARRATVVVGAAGSGIASAAYLLTQLPEDK